MLLLMMAALVTASPADSVIGIWHSPTKNGIIHIEKCGSSICGALEDGDDLRANPNARDVNNVDQAKRPRALRGITMLSGFHWDDGVWSDGQVYNPNDGHTYSGKITPLDGHALKLRGCVFFPLCKTEIWTRVR